MLVFLVISLGIHEAAHAWVALKCGDTTARDLGRITLNPIPHIDPIMTIVVPAFLYMTAGFVFGGAKPVPVNFFNLRRPYRDMALVAIAGPASNFLLALLFFLILKVLIDFDLYTADQRLPQVMWAAVNLNLLLACFNLFPIPPLDGSRVLAWLLPRSLREPYVRLEAFGMIIVMGLFFTGLLSGPLWATMDAMYDAVEWTVTLGGLW